MSAAGFSRGVMQLAASAWVGALWAVGYLAVPVLFRAQPDRQLAGMLAGEMFAGLAYLGLVCAALLLALMVREAGAAVFRQRACQFVLAMALLTLVSQFGLQPLMAELKAQALPLEVMHSPYASQFRSLHGVSSILFLLQSLLGAGLLLKLNRPL